MKYSKKISATLMDILRARAAGRVHQFITQYRSMHLLKSQGYINGEWVKSVSNEVFPVQNPADDSVITELPEMNVEDTKKAIEAAHNAFSTWKKFTAKERSKILRKWFNLCEKNKEELAKIVTAEAGKPLAESKSEITYGSSFIEWFADTARHNDGEIIQSPWPNKQILVTRHPVGVVSVITPWNFPNAMITRKVAALMAAGCTCVVKPSDETPLSALALTQLAEEAGVPKGVINVVTGSSKNIADVGRVLCEHDKIACITFTGSNNVGKLLYGIAAKGIKRVALELGGNAPFIVFPSADLERAINMAVVAKFRNSGQACVAANRFFIHESIYDKFVEGIKSVITKKCVLGYGDKQGTTMGPLINLKQTQTVSKLVKDSVDKGAKVVLGGKVKTELGNKFYEPTVVVDINPSMPLYSEEIFGPVVSCLKFTSEEEVTKLANDNKNGLASYVFTKELGQAFRMSKNLEYGMVAINDGEISAAEPPFGGVKEAGIGREGSKHGLAEFTDIKYTLMSNLDK